jgi:hypothetical protein
MKYDRNCIEKYSIFRWAEKYRNEVENLASSLRWGSFLLLAPGLVFALPCCKANLIACSRDIDFIS